ncbi:hypothetical protein IAT40_007800 [Kwoniella sp. CBS 6097]
MVFLNFFSRRRMKRQVDMCVLDIPIKAYDPSTGLPATISLGGKEAQPYISLQEVKGHLTFLSAISDLQSSFTPQNPSQASSISVEDVVLISTEPYIHWVQQILPLHRQNGSFRNDEGESSESRKERSNDSEAVKQLRKDDIPSLGVLMAWLTHLLNPVQYDNDLNGKFVALRGLDFPLAEIGTAIREGSLPPIKPLDEAQESTLQTHDESSSTEWTSRDIALAVQRQAKFVGHMKTIGWLDEDHWEKKGFSELQFGVVLYHAWLDLIHSTESKYFLVPRLDIDLAWHTHQLHPNRYKIDTAELLGNMLNHDDAAGEGKLGDGLEVTKRLWKKRFGYAYM